MTAMPRAGPAGRPLVLVGCVSQLYQGDLDLGRRAAERLASERLPGAVVEDLHYGAVAVGQLLEDLQPDQLVLVGAEARDRPPGTVERRLVGQPPPDSAANAIECAVTGYVDIDLVVNVAAGLGTLPGRVVAVEVEPASVEPSDRLSAAAAAALEPALDLVRAEVRQAPVVHVAGQVRQRLAERPPEPGPVITGLVALLDAVDLLDRDGRLGATFLRRDRLRLAIVEGASPEGVDALDWALWWSLIEELDRLQGDEAGAVDA